MKSNALLVATSLLAVLLLSLHITDDIVRGIDSAGPTNLFAILILVVLLVGIHLVGSRTGYVILLLGALFAVGMPVLHLRGPGLGALVRSDGGFFYLWTLFALGVTGTASFLLTIQGLWRLRQNAPR